MFNNKKNSIGYISIVLILLCGSLRGTAQVNYGENPEKCKQKLSIMTTYYKQKAYLSAAPSWRYIIENCPESSKNTYIIGSKIMEQYIKEADSPELKYLYVDSLLMNQDLRIKYFPNQKPNKQKAKKAIYLLKYRLKEEYQTAFQLLDSAFTNGPNELSAYDFQMYLYCYKLMIKSKVRQCDQMLETYLTINQLLEQREQAGKKIKNNTKNKITEYAEICMDCDLLDSLYFSNYEKRKNDTTWLDNGILLFKRKQCNSSTTFLTLLETRYLSKPNAKTASTLGMYFLNIQDYDKANSYFSDAIELEKDSTKLAVHHVNKSKYFIVTKDYRQAFNESKKAIREDKSVPGAYLTAGDAIAYSASQCKSLTFGGKETYWLAVDYYGQVLRLSDDEKEKARAKQKIAKFKKFFPEKGDLFMKSLEEGDSYKVGCFLNEKTKIRSLK
jgi:tetratricopeptide (TPR) repeat protein